MSNPDQVCQLVGAKLLQVTNDCDIPTAVFARTERDLRSPSRFRKARYIVDFEEIVPEFLSPPDRWTLQVALGVAPQFATMQQHEVHTVK